MLTDLLPLLQHTRPIAYIGPGAGIALVGSFLAVLGAILSAMITWPIRRIAYAIRGNRARLKARTRRVVIVGLDGLEPTLTEGYLEAGLLPNLAKLKEQGGYQRMRTTYPPLSPGPALRPALIPENTISLISSRATPRATNRRCRQCVFESPNES